MIRLITLDPVHRKVVIVDDHPGLPHGRSTLLSDGANGLPTYESFLQGCPAALELVETAGDLLGYLDREAIEEDAAPQTRPKEKGKGPRGRDAKPRGRDGVG